MDSLDYDLTTGCMQQLLQQGGTFAETPVVHTLNTQLLSFYTVVSNMQYNV